MPFLQGDLYVNQPLTRSAVSGMQKAENFVAPTAFPRLIVDKPSGIYHKWNLADLNRNEMQARAENAPARVANFGKSDATYSVPTESLAYDLNDTARKAASAALDPSKVIPRVLLYKALIRLEHMLATKCFVSTGWYRTVTGNASDSVTEGTTSTRKRWTDTSSNPIAQILQEKEYQSKLTGFEPDGLIFGRKAWTAFRTHPTVLATLSGTVGGIRSAPATLVEVAAILELKYVRVSSAIYNQNGAGLTASNARIVPEESALLYYRGADGDDPGEWNDDMPVGATSQVWQDGAGNREGLRIRTFRDEKAGAGGSDHSEIDTFRDYGVVTPEMGTLFEDMTDGI